MAEPTLKDVLEAIARIRGETKTEFARLEAKLDAHRAETKTESARIEAKLDAHRAETAKGFADLDEELTGHAKVHKEIEKDIELLKRRPPRTAARPTRRR